VNREEVADLFRQLDGPGIVDETFMATIVEPICLLVARRGNPAAQPASYRSSGIGAVKLARQPAGFVRKPARSGSQRSCLRRCCWSRPRRSRRGMARGDAPQRSLGKDAKFRSDWSWVLKKVAEDGYVTFDEERAWPSADGAEIPM
jgi:hypothetical protein